MWIALIRIRKIDSILIKISVQFSITHRYGIRNEHRINFTLQYINLLCFIKKINTIKFLLFFIINEDSKIFWFLTFQRASSITNVMTIASFKWEYDSGMYISRNGPEFIRMPLCPFNKVFHIVHFSLGYWQHTIKRSFLSKIIIWKIFQFSQ